jgi:general secretion pathway protein G
MKRSGFTMIELIFVIVILGILAAVAIPKLAATRDDAKIAKAAQEVSIAIQDFGAYYTAQGSLSTTETMSNVDFKNDANLSGVADFYVVDGDDCVEFNATVAAAEDGNFTVSAVAGATGVCAGVQSALTANNVFNTYSFGGKRVKW